jgi:DNA repair protein RadC
MNKTSSIILHPSSFRNGHRERLRSRFLDGKLVDYELLELLLTYALPRIDTKPVAHKLIRHFGGVHKVLAASLDELAKVRGIGKNTAFFIKALHAITVLHHKDKLSDTPVFHEYDILMNYCLMKMVEIAVEEFHILYMDDKYRLMCHDVHSSGTIDWTAVYPREIVKRALEKNARHVCLLHNHPNGDTVFSPEDYAITKELRRILSAMDISVFDHILVANGQVFSAKNLRLMDFL